MKHLIQQLLNNRVLCATLLGWLVAQSLKVLLGVVREKRFNFRWFVGTGGMPSAHSAGVSSLATAIGMTQGFSSPLFAVSLIFALVTMFDAQGVRRAAGQQAKILNAIVEDIYWKRPIAETRLKGLLGHTPVEVFVGAAIGILLAIACVSA
ncbi:MAG: divergent PAP2 family protein [Candidatus Omnitrophica bacterium]|nr:divergent PAP2 family protein [Candidatus Omnitrophota bacterium]